jgi:hypothetical protein
MLGATQPYHFVQDMAVADAQKHLDTCLAIAVGLAKKALQQLADELSERGYALSGAAVLQASDRALPELSRVLAAHPLLHTAEGLFFRRVFQDASEDLGLPVARIREKGIAERADLALGEDAVRVRQAIETMGKKIRSPWTADQKLAALAAWIALEGGSRARAAR